MIDFLKHWLDVKRAKENKQDLEFVILNDEQLSNYAVELAFSHRVKKEGARKDLLKEIADNEKELNKAYQKLNIKENREDVLLSTEWLLDNFYLIKEHLRLVRTNLPKNYAKQLPHVINANNKIIIPRIYDIAMQLIQHEDGRFDLEILRTFINAYQKVSNLQLGELWSIPLMLAIALIDRLSIASSVILKDKEAKYAANRCTDNFIEASQSESKDLLIIFENVMHLKKTYSNSFLTELIRRLQIAALSIPLNWIEKTLEKENASVEIIVQHEAKRQALIQTTISNCINSLRRLEIIDWRKFIESVSLVNYILAKDPANVYTNMQFQTRDKYRHVIEKLAQKTKKSEAEIADEVVQLARTAIEQHKPRKYTHVGYYLIDDGFYELEKKFVLNKRHFQNKSKLNVTSRTIIYFGAMFILNITILLSAFYFISFEYINISIYLLLFILLTIIVSQPVKEIIDTLSTYVIQPMHIPRMNYEYGIPEENRSLVVVLAMLDSIEKAQHLLQALEVYYLGNKDKNLHFMLLTDFNDASLNEMPHDNELTSFVSKEIISLNERYNNNDLSLFYFLHRKRHWNEVEKLWIGRERKRGKLSDLNKLICDGVTENFSAIVGNLQILCQIKYVITLDSDTDLPRESARHYIELMAHPLNTPFVDEKLIVTKGYAILQPRIGELITNRKTSRYLQIIANEYGIDPYTRMVSNVYQDLFHQGSFIGKGIYDVKVFHQILSNRFPNNRILSHDLLEGCYLHCGYVSDIPLFEPSPTNYLSDVMRKIRWIRGDWQLLPWLRKKVKNKNNQLEVNPLTFISKWKIFDNLRRSCFSISIMFFLMLSWLIPKNGLTWFIIMLIIIVLPIIFETSLHLIRHFYSLIIHKAPSHVKLNKLTELLLSLICLPYEAWFTFCAICTTLWRLFVSKKHLLEWMPSDQASSRIKDTTKAWLRTMWVNPFIALVATTILFINQQYTYLLISSALFMLWFISPLIMKYLSQPIKYKAIALSQGDLNFLRKVARKTWFYFETFITADHHWLPPDNFQEIPKATVANRTSPTNIGFGLLTNLTAYDFGYITPTQLLIRINNIFNTLKNLETYGSHFYNWYDTKTLQPLTPRYISTVDSGNLAGYLLVLKQGLIALLKEPILKIQYLYGLEDVIDVLIEFRNHPLFLNLKKLMLDLHPSFESWHTAYEAMTLINKEIDNILTTFKHANESSDELLEWLHQLSMQGQYVFDEISLFRDLPNIEINSNLESICKANNNQNEFAYIFEVVFKRIASINQLSQQSFLFSQMDISLLCDPTSNLLTIGYNVDEKKMDPGRYDLLSSEARFGIFVAIAQGKLMQDSWFALNRVLIRNGHDVSLVSWSGSMFEYLMPLLVMPTYPFTLLDQTYHSAVKQQIIYGRLCDIPWGISESGFNVFDSQSNYLYRAFGVPGLGLKRGLENELVIAPYASALALMINPKSACDNLQQLAKQFYIGKYGFYEAIDYTKSRLSGDRKRNIIRSFMTHHQGMIFLAISYLLHQQPMQRRFVADPLFKATLLLLQEAIPKISYPHLELPKSRVKDSLNSFTTSKRIFNGAQTSFPHTQLLSNGRYHVVISQAGGGYSHWHNTMISRWREDSTCDNWGTFIFLRDVDTKEYFTATYQPAGNACNNYKVIFTPKQAEFMQTNLKLDVHLEIVVSPEDDIELRRVRVRNRSSYRHFDFTSFFEIVLSSHLADMSHPAFNKLFIETSIVYEKGAILAHRRTKDIKQFNPWMFHLLNVHKKKNYVLSYETSRYNFFGRNGNLINPLAMQQNGNLSNTEGAVLDPIASIRCRMVLAPDELITFDLITGITDTKEKTLALINKYNDERFANRIFSLAYTHEQVLIHQLNIHESDALLYERLASAMIYCNRFRRGKTEMVKQNKLGQAKLWPYSLSGDLPIMLVYIKDVKNVKLVRQLIQAQAYWRLKGLEVDLVIINNEPTSYRSLLQELIINLIAANQTLCIDHACKIVLQIADQISQTDIILLESVARVVLSDQHGTLREQLYQKFYKKNKAEILYPIKKSNYFSHNILELQPPKNLLYFNGFGGFTEDGKEYVIHLEEGKNTPEPWINILSNPFFGTIISESGQGYTWIENANLYRITPWENDSLLDKSEELYYLRDDETGLIWSPTPLPCRGKGAYQISHGFGYSSYLHIEQNIKTKLCVYLAEDLAIKFITLDIENLSKYPRKLSTYGFIGWVLGDLKSKNFMHVVTELSNSGGLLAYNYYNDNFAERTAFYDAWTDSENLLERTFTCDRTEFIGRNSHFKSPLALKNLRLSNTIGAKLDPCAAIQLTYHLAPNASRKIIFFLGVGKDKIEAELYLLKYCHPVYAQLKFTSSQLAYEKLINKIKVTTPDSTINILMNGWLLHQIISSRLWGKTGYYQSSGAFGFRDQLQDVMALLQVSPEMARAQILLSASHQFEEGDVQHWWHPPLGNGVRSRCSDDYLWLPLTLAYYLKATGDYAILSERRSFLQGRALNVNEESYYELPSNTNNLFTIYEHAVRAIKYGLKFGIHGLPLIGSGDWNDGMNLVGIQGKGESVWLGFFLYHVLIQFESIAKKIHDEEFAHLCRETSNTLQKQINLHGFDGNWYKRAYFDDGKPLGSQNNEECKIDSIAQSWSVISGASDDSYAQKAMHSLKKHLFNKDKKLMLLLSPPFHKTYPSPGYIQGYVPGIRENGAQYTHAAVWAAMAYAMLGDKETAWEIVAMINPIVRSDTNAKALNYKLEPYVTAGDIYSNAMHIGRGGWSWYTGSAGWFYQLILQNLLGIYLEEGKYLRLAPLIPENWPGFEIDYQYFDTHYLIKVQYTSNNSCLLVDGVEITANRILLINDSHIHNIYLSLNKTSSKDANK